MSVQFVNLKHEKIPTVNLMDIDLFIKLGTSAKEEGSVFFYTYKQRSDLNSDAAECLCIEILNRRSKNLILNLSYKPPQGDTILFEKNLQDLPLKNDICKKEILVKGDFNINLLDYENNKKVQSLLNLMFRCGIVPTINKPTRVKRYLRLQLFTYLQILL